MKAVVQLATLGVMAMSQAESYSDGVARLFAANGIDLRALRLTPQDFVSR